MSFTFVIEDPPKIKIKKRRIKTVYEEAYESVFGNKKKTGQRKTGPRRKKKRRRRRRSEPTFEIVTTVLHIVRGNIEEEPNELPYDIAYLIFTYLKPSQLFELVYTIHKQESRDQTKESVLKYILTNSLVFNYIVYDIDFELIEDFYSSIEYHPRANIIRHIQRWLSLKTDILEFFCKVPFLYRILRENIGKKKLFIDGQTEKYISLKPFTYDIFYDDFIKDVKQNKKFISLVEKERKELIPALKQLRNLEDRKFIRGEPINEETYMELRLKSIKLNKELSKTYYKLYEQSRVHMLIPMDFDLPEILLSLIVKKEEEDFWDDKSPSIILFSFYKFYSYLNPVPSNLAITRLLTIFENAKKTDESKVDYYKKCLEFIKKTIVEQNVKKYVTSIKKFLPNESSKIWIHNTIYGRNIINPLSNISVMYLVLNHVKNLKSKPSPEDIPDYLNYRPIKKFIKSTTSKLFQFPDKPTSCFDILCRDEINEAETLKKYFVEKHPSILSLPIELDLKNLKNIFNFVLDISQIRDLDVIWGEESFICKFELLLDADIIKYSDDPVEKEKIIKWVNEVNYKRMKIVSILYNIGEDVEELNKLKPSLAFNSLTFWNRYKKWLLPSNVIKLRGYIN